MAPWRHPRGAYQAETFSVGSDAQSLARADGFETMVDSAGQRWPDGWVKGEGFVRAAGTDPLKAPPRFDDIGEEYVRQIVDLSPGQRKRYLGQLQGVAKAKVRGSYLFSRPVTSIHESDIKDRLIDWDRSLKTNANYHGLMHGVFANAVKRGYLAMNPGGGDRAEAVAGQAVTPRAAVPHRAELETVVQVAGVHGDLLSVTVGTGLRCGGVRALWVGDVDLDHRTLRVDKAWKRSGEDDETDNEVTPYDHDLPDRRRGDHALSVPRICRPPRYADLDGRPAGLLGDGICARSA